MKKGFTALAGAYIGDLKEAGWWSDNERETK